MRATTRKLNYRNRTELSLADISRLHNPILRGWLAYYGRFYRSALYPVFRHLSPHALHAAAPRSQRPRHQLTHPIQLSWTSPLPAMGVEMRTADGFIRAAIATPV
ncbi:group II intron maturase-specific domain-containing protein, partial [Accumulibacter sp.]